MEASFCLTMFCLAFCCVFFLLCGGGGGGYRGVEQFRLPVLHSAGRWPSHPTVDVVNLEQQPDQAVHRVLLS